MNYKNIIKGFDIIKAADMYDPMVEYAEKGALKGAYLGFPALHPNYTMSLPGVTDWTGFPRSGKTQVLLEFLMNTSEFYGWRHLVYLPDVGNDKEILADLIHKKTGKSFDRRYSNHIEEYDIAAALPWITEHFLILTKKDLKAKLTPFEFWDLAAEIKRNSGLHTATIDSWKDMNHNESDFGRSDQYLESVLSYRNALAEKEGLHLHTIVHPLKTDKDSSGDRKPPSPYDIKGGTEWFNNGKNMVTIHRPAGEENLVEIYWNKIKPRSIGEVGQSIMHFDSVKFRYYTHNGDEKRYAEKEIWQTNAEKLQAAQTTIFNSSSGDEDSDIPF